MHEYLRSIGFPEKMSRKELTELVNWVLEKPDHMTIAAVDEETCLAEASREIGVHAGIRVIGEIDEGGQIIPEFYFPYVECSQISSDAQITYEKQTDRHGFVGMCEDYRLGMALIFSVSNVGDVLRNEKEKFFGTSFTKASFSLLASDATVLLPVDVPEKVLEKHKGERENRQKLMQEAHEGNAAALEAITRHEVNHFQHVMDKLRRTDIFTVVETFFMPHGMESDRYYLMGKIVACQHLTNELTEGGFWRMILEVNDMTVCVAVSDRDLTGEPQAGRRLRCHAWLQGQMR